VFFSAFFSKQCTRKNITFALKIFEYKKYANDFVIRFASVVETREEPVSQFGATLICEIR